MEQMIRSHGALAVAAALIRAVFRRKKIRPRPIRVADLSRHLRRDIGLDPDYRGPHDWNPFRGLARLQSPRPCTQGSGRLIGVV